jgi:hypothetical protein
MSDNQSELVKRVRALHPGAYDDLGDAQLEAAILDKYPQYRDLATPTTGEPAQGSGRLSEEHRRKLDGSIAKMQANGESENAIRFVVSDFKSKYAPRLTTREAKPEPPSIVDSTLIDNPALPLPLRAMQGALRIAKRNPVASAAMIGGTLAAIPTGGASFPVAMAASGLGAAGGAGAAIAGRQLATGTPEPAADTLRTMGTEGALSAIGEGTGRAVGGLLRIAGRGLYRAGLLPDAATLRKFPEVVTRGVETATPVSRGGLKKAVNAKGEALTAKQLALEAADQNVAFRTGQLAQDLHQPTAEYARSLRRAGLPDPTPRFADRTAEFIASNPPGLTPTEAETIKRTVDDRLGGAFRKIAKREPVTPSERFSMELSRQIGNAQEATIPGYRTMNRDIMDAEGLRRAIERRTAGSGGNQGLENALTIVGGPHTIPARLAMLPPVLSGVGIAAYQAGKRPAAMSTMLRAALAMMEGEHGTDK